MDSEVYHPAYTLHCLAPLAGTGPSRNVTATCFLRAYWRQIRTQPIHLGSWHTRKCACHQSTSGKKHHYSCCLFHGSLHEVSVSLSQVWKKSLQHLDTQHACQNEDPLPNRKRIPIESECGDSKLRIQTVVSVDKSQKTGKNSRPNY